MSFLESLKEQYPETQTIAPWGECLVIPTSQFKEDWRSQLAELGLACHFGSWDRQAVVFVQLKRVAVEGKVVYVPPPKPVVTYHPPIQSQSSVVEVKKEVSGYHLRGNVWTAADEERLCKRFEEVEASTAMGKLRLLLPEFPGRNIAALVQKLHKLQRKKLKKDGAPKQKRGGYHRNDKWSPDEDALLVDLWNRQPFLTIAQVAAGFQERFASRTVGAVGNRLTDLQEQGVIMRRHEKAVADATDALANSSKIEALEKSVAVLQEAYDAQVKAFVELKTGVDNLLFAVGKANSLGEELEELTEKLRVHKHAQGSGEAMLPMEAAP